MVLLCFSLLPAAYGYPGLADGTHRIINRNSGKPLTVEGGSTNIGANVVQSSATGGSDQLWSFQNIGSNQYRIVNGLNHRYLDVYGASSDDGANVNLWDYTGGTNQIWVIEPTSEGYYTVKALHSGKCLAVNQGSTSDGANALQWSANGAPDQEWLIEPAALGTPTGVAATTANGLVTLTWNAIPGSVKFDIKRSTTSGSGYTTIATGYPYNTYYDSMMAPGATYYYVVTARNFSDESPASAEVSATPLSPEQEWRNYYFGSPANAGNGADDANPDHDEFTNVWERRFGTSPTNGKEPSLQPLVGIDASNQLTFLYRKSKISRKSDFTVQENSVPGEGWTPAPGATQLVSEDATARTLLFATPLGTNAKNFLRLAVTPKDRPRVIVTTDGEADDQASMVRFLLTCDEVEVEGIVNSSSDFHWVGGAGWNAFHPVSWVQDYIYLYAQVYNNLLLHNPNYPSPEYLLSRWKVGNTGGGGEYATRTEGAKLIADILLDASDPRPVWVQVWGGCNTLAAALKIIQDDHPTRMAEVAAKLRIFLIWEQDGSYQAYIRPVWEPLQVLTINSDQFDCIAYEWPNDLPASLKASHFNSPWVANNIVNGHGALCAAYVNNNGAFNAEGDTPSFLHSIPNGLRSTESPGWGGWGGRYVKVRNNMWMDIPPAAGWTHPTGRWFIDNSWAKELLKSQYSQSFRENYFKPIWRWLSAVQNDMAARADWCVMNYASANHHPIVRLKTPLDVNAAPGTQVTLDATPTTDPDGNTLNFRWWNYSEADSYAGAALPESTSAKTTVTVPAGAQVGDEIHMICEVTDTGTPPLTRYQRVVIHVVAP